MKRQFKMLAIMTLVIAFTSCKSSKESTSTSRQNTEKKQQKSGGNRSQNTPPSFTELLKKMDTNKDGKISKSEAKGRLKENFDKRDVNNDGYIVENEMTKKRR